MFVNNFLMFFVNFFIFPVFSGCEILRFAQDDRRVRAAEGIDPCRLATDH